ncbi:MAG TPA: COX15/CtaA family protein [Caulobacteraceae bacterium]|jgi:cytochrome c oxidase assembly protein subunit 15|nr:COX15/CtaA family protein [Caulobacteraceae bacterium]
MRWRYNLERSQAVAIWLFAVAVMILAIVVVGGATRLTGSGLSITEWRPVTGVLPPLSQQAWAAEFEKYRHIPQYQFVNQGMTLAAFKSIYWWEWTHRLLGRLVGVLFVVPFAVFLALRQIPRRLIWRCLVILALGGLQGLVGWWMVKSGLSARVSVAPERLAIHLGLALVVLCACVWNGLEAWFGKARVGYVLQKRWRWSATALPMMAFAQSLLGALVAGNDAGQVYNDWPAMGGRVVPEDYVPRGWGLGRALLHSQGAVQFDHRIGAYLLFVAAVAFAVAVSRARLPSPVKVLAHLLATLVLLQAGLGIWTLMSHAPLGLSSLHQIGAVAVLACAVVLAWRVRRPAN